MVVTAKYAPNAALHLEHLGLARTILVGWHWGPKKGEALTRARRVGLRRRPHRRHPGGAGGRRGGGLGRHRAGAARRTCAAAGSDVVLADLRGFPAWLDGYLAA